MIHEDTILHPATNTRVDIVCTVICLDFSIGKDKNNCVKYSVVVK